MINYFLFSIMLSLRTSAGPDTPAAIFDNYNKAKTYKQMRKAVSGKMLDLLLLVKKKRGEKGVLKNATEMRLKSYKSEEIRIAKNIIFLVIKKPVRYQKSAVAGDSKGLIFRKTTEGWKWSNIFSPSNLRYSLWKYSYTPKHFQFDSSFQFDGSKSIQMRTAFATIDKDNIVLIDFYPYKMEKVDIEYQKYFGFITNVSKYKESNSYKQKKNQSPRAYIRLEINKNSEIEHLTVGINNFTDSKGLIAISQIKKKLFQNFSFKNGIINLISKAQVETHDKKTLKWDVNLSINVIKKGIF